MKDIAWAAGVFEGEGDIRGAKAGRGGIQVRVSQKDPWLTARLVHLFGGSNNHERATARHWMWRWKLCGPRGLGFALTIYALLSPRRKLQMRRALGATE